MTVRRILSGIPTHIPLPEYVNLGDTPFHTQVATRHRVTFEYRASIFLMWLYYHTKTALSIVFPKKVKKPSPGNYSCVNIRTTPSVRAFVCFLIRNFNLSCSCLTRTVFAYYFKHQLSPLLAAATLYFLLFAFQQFRKDLCLCLNPITPTFQIQL